MKIRKVLPYGAAFLLGLSALLTINIGKSFAAANNCLWTGGGDGTSVSDIANWSNCGGIAPVSGDSLTFDSSTMGLSAVNNDVVGLSIVSLSQQGTGGNGLILTGNSLTITGGIASTSDQDVDIENDLVISGAQTFSIPIANSAFLDGSITGSGHVTLSGGGVLQLYGDNSGFSGGFQTADGGIDANTATALGTGTATITDGGVLNINFDTDTTFSTPLSLGGNGPSGNPSGAALYMSTVAFAGDGTTATWSGPITLTSDVLVGGFGNRILKVTGPLSGNFSMTPATSTSNGVILNNSSSNTSNTASGYVPVTVAAGDNQPGTGYVIDNHLTFIIDGTRGAVTVDSGGTLKGTGTVGDTTVNGGGTIAPGHSPGCMNTGNLILNGNYDAEIGGTTACSGYDQLKVTGTVNVNSATLNASLYNGFKPAAGQSYTIIDNDGTDAVTGTFNNLAQGATINISGYVLKVSYTGGDGNDVVLSVVSVPTTPNTGFAMISSHPGATLAATVLSTAGILIIARKSKSLVPVSKR